MKTCVFDIETTDLAAVGSGWILCAVILDADRGTKQVYRYDESKCELGHEAKLVEAIVKALSEYPVWIGHNIDKFDWPYIKSRANALGIPIHLDTTVTYDTLKAFRRSGLRTIANSYGKPTGRLDHIADFFGIEQLKTPIYPREHWVTVWGQGVNRRKAMDKLVDHCLRDVKLNDQVYRRLWLADPYPHFQPTH